MNRLNKRQGCRHAQRELQERLPDIYPYVVTDMLRYCKPGKGLWVDLGSGDGGIGLELARESGSTVVLIDPNAEALGKAVRKATEAGVKRWVFAVAGCAEALPLPDGIADLVVSRGSIFFWDDPPEGLREVYRILRRGARAMIGGGLGQHYPQWARQEFTRRRHEGVRSRGQGAYAEFKRVRHSDTFKGWAQAAGLSDFTVVGEGARDPDGADAGLGIWLCFAKE